MKKRGVTFIEIVIAITIFLIGILPVTYLTLNSLNNLKRSSEIEEGARITSTVINYIKSRGYDYLLANPIADDPFLGLYNLTYSSPDGAYISTSFEDDFYVGTSLDGNIFFIESLGIDLEGSTFNVVMKQSDLHLASSDGTIINYTNPVSGESSDTVLGENGITPDKIIYGLVQVEYTTKSTTDSSNIRKKYEQPFVVTPLENF